MNKLDPSQSPQDGVPAWFGPVVSGLAGLALVAGLGLRSAQESFQAESRVEPAPSAWALELEPEFKELELSQTEIPHSGADAPKRQS